MQELQLDDLYDVWFTSFWQTLPGYAILVLLGVALVGILYLIVRFIGIYRLGTSKDRALRKLRELSRKVDVNNAELRSIYQELTSITKSYCRWRYDMPRGMTDYELITFLESTDCPPSQVREVERVATDVQAVKFGPVEPSKQQVLKDIEAICAFISSAGGRNDSRK